MRVSMAVPQSMAVMVVIFDDIVTSLVRVVQMGIYRLHCSYFMEVYHRRQVIYIPFLPL